MDKLLLKQIDPVRKAQFFGVLFDRTPKYDEINPGNQNPLELTGVNQLFALAKLQKSLMVTLRDSIYKQIIGEIVRWNDCLSNVALAT